MATKTKARATIEDLHRVQGKAEIVDGELLVMEPTGFMPTRASLAIAISLRDYERRTRRGWALSDNAAFVVNLPHRQSFSPDAAFFVGKTTGMKFLEGAPVFAAEVRSEHDYGPSADEKLARKRADYFAAGTLVVWDVDLAAEDVISVYRATAPREPTRYRRTELAEAEPALPGWTMAVDDLFD